MLSKSCSCVGKGNGSWKGNFFRIKEKEFFFKINENKKSKFMNKIKSVNINNIHCIYNTYNKK